jgi:hypothetical protein
MSHRNLTQAEIDAYREMAAAAEKLKQAQAEAERCRETLSMTPQNTGVADAEKERAVMNDNYNARPTTTRIPDPI